jgi:hypothetical protein
VQRLKQNAGTEGKCKDRRKNAGNEGNIQKLKEKMQELK